MALNYACSLLTPIDPETEEILIEMTECHKRRINHKLAREMMTELKPWDFDITQLGTSYHANHCDEGIVEEKSYKKDDRLSIYDGIKSRKKEEKKEGPHVVSFHISTFWGLILSFEWILACVLQYDEEEAIAEFQVDDGGQEGLTDFLIKPYIKAHEYEQEAEDMIYPLDFYDNDDGYWDEFIAEKKQTYNDIPMLTKRYFLKH